MRNMFTKLDGGSINLPIFFPDATQAVIRTLDSIDIGGTKTPGLLVNTYHLWRNLGKDVLRRHGGVREFMGWHGGVISDSGGFQVMSIAKSQSSKKAVRDEGVYFKPVGSKKRVLFTPEDSIRFQMILRSDMVVVLDDFTPPGADKKTARETVERTIVWAKRCKREFEKECKRMNLERKPYLLGVVQGGEWQDLRKECAARLEEIGFDGFGYGGWPIRSDGEFDYESSETIVENTPEGYMLYGLGIGKPDEIVGCVKRGYHIFDCVLPTRDARHKRLYVYNVSEIEKIDLKDSDFYSYYVPDKEKYYKDDGPISGACDCLLCKNYSRAYLAHLFRIKDLSAMRLATIHNLRFYSLLMEKLRDI